MVHQLRCRASLEATSRQRVARNLVVVVFLGLGAASLLSADETSTHYLHQGGMPPGAIGSWQLQRGGPLPGFFQPVEIKAPQGASVSLAIDGTFEEPRSAPRKIGMLIGQVYRIRVMQIPMRPGAEVFPTIEIVDRLYAPQDQQRRFPIPIQLTEEDLRLAIDGKFVTRVIYLEDPTQAMPVREDSQGNWFDVGPTRDPLSTADALGRPVAILRLGARLPDPAEAFDATFLFGCPPFADYPSPQPEILGQQ